MPDPRAQVEERIFVLLSALAEAADELRIPWLVTGAMGRVLLLERVYGLPHGRATEDVDFGVMVKSWDHFSSLVKRICRDSRFRRDTKQAQRLRFTTDTYIDLIPFGGVESADHKIHWPPDGDFEMSVAGFREAYDDAIPVLVNKVLEARVVSPAGLLLLKLIAWQERHLAQPRRDAADMAYVLRRYGTVLTEKTLFDEHLDIMEAAGYDPEKVAALLLGQRLKEIASPNTRDQVLGLLERELESGVDSILVREIANSWRPTAADRIYDLLNQLRTGLKE